MRVFLAVAAVFSSGVVLAVPPAAAAGLFLGVAMALPDGPRVGLLVVCDALAMQSQFTDREDEDYSFVSFK